MTAIDQVIGIPSTEMNPLRRLSNVSLSSVALVACLKLRWLLPSR